MHGAKFTYIVVFLGLAQVFIVAGCDKGKMPTYSVRGNVTYPDKRPLAGVWVSFRSSDNGLPVMARGQTDANGEFTLSTFSAQDGAITGVHQAIVACPEVSPRFGNETPKTPPIDARYSRFETSGLEYTVTTDPAQNQFTIHVTPPKQPSRTANR